MKKKYSISKSGMDTLMKKLSKIAQEGLEDPVGFKEIPITTSFVKAVTKVKGLEDVIERNEHLTKNYKGLLDLYGFENMYDMYLYAKSCDIYQEEMLPTRLLKNRDVSRLVPVKRKVVRNGKEVEVTVYENPNKDMDNKSDLGSRTSSSSSNNEGRTSHARELIGNMRGYDSPINTKDIAKLKVAAASMSGGDRIFQDGSEFYLELADNNGGIAGIVGYSADGEYLTMDFFKSNGKVAGVAARGFSELIMLALKQKKGVKVKDDPKARPVFMQFGLGQEGQYWTISYKDLSQALGKSGKESG